MSAPRIDQLLAGFGDGDATSSAAMALRDAFRALGHESDIYAPPAHVSPTLRDACRPLEACRPGPDDVMICHYGISSPATAVFLSARCRKVLLYHNITPAEYFDGYDDTVARQLRDARAELREISLKADAVWAVSKFNASELEAFGVPKVSVLELPFSLPATDVPPDPEVFKRITAPLTTILFVGRIAPNKRVEDLIHAFAWYHQTINRQSRLLIIGSNRSAPRYYTMLRMLIGDLDQQNICLEGFASHAGLMAYYQASHLYVSPSEHEGYGLPLLEAMYKGLPVLSRAAGGTPEAMGGAGILYEELGPRDLAELMHLALSDSSLRESVLLSQRQRVERALSRDLTRELRDLLAG